MKIITIHQPDFLPWLGFFHRLIQSDLFVVLDTVQYVRRGWHNRVNINTKNGVKWLTVPVISKNQFKQSIKDTRICKSEDWQSKHLRILSNSYRKAPYFDEIFPHFIKVYEPGFSSLPENNMAFLSTVIQILNITIDIKFASETPANGINNDLLIELVQYFEGTTYVSGTGAKNYLNVDAFNNKDIKVVWQEFTDPIYPHINNNFLPKMSIIDCLFNCGKKQTKSLLEQTL